MEKHWDIEIFQYSTIFTDLSIQRNINTYVWNVTNLQFETSWNIKTFRYLNIFKSVNF